MNKRNLLIVGGVVVVVLLVGLYTRKNTKNSPPNQQLDTQSAIIETSDQVSSTLQTASSTTSTSGSTVPPKTYSVAPKPVTTLSATQKYLDALRVYKTAGYYFQFVSCHGTPGSLTLKKGKKFMLDNRDNVARKIAVDKQVFKIGAYSYTIATAPYTVGTYYITCDGGGSASIKVQP